MVTHLLFAVCLLHDASGLFADDLSLMSIDHINVHCMAWQTMLNMSRTHAMLIASLMPVFQESH